MLLIASYQPIFGWPIKHLQLGTGTSFSPRGETKFFIVQLNEALAAGDQGGQGWLEDDSWATHAMAGLVLVSPLGVWGALAATHALLLLTGHFAFNEPALL